MRRVARTAAKTKNATNDKQNPKQLKQKNINEDSMKLPLFANPPRLENQVAIGEPTMQTAALTSNRMTNQFPQLLSSLIRPQ